VLAVAIVALALAFLGPPLRASADDAVSRVDLLTISDAIDPINAQYVGRGLDQATRDGAALVLIEMNTPGGLDTPMRDITAAMLKSPVPVVVYVTPAGARAGSAGVFILMASDVAAMAPETNVGAAHPVGEGGDNLPPDIRDKITNDAAAYMRVLATTRHHNATWAEQAVRQSVALTADEAKQQDVINLVSRDRATLLNDLDGWMVQRPDKTIQLRTKGATVVPIEMTVPERLLHLIDDPNVAYLLLSIGAWAILAELFHPGSILPGVVGLLCMALGLTAIQSLPLNWTGLALLGVALALFVIDLKVTSHGALTAAGLATFVIGSLMLFAPVASPLPGLLPDQFSLGVSPVLVGLIGIGLTIFFVFAVRASLRARHRPAMALLTVTSGANGVATTDLQPSGSVRVKGENWTAVAENGPIRQGEPIQVVTRQGVHLVVRRAKE